MSEALLDALTVLRAGRAPSAWHLIHLVAGCLAQGWPIRRAQMSALTVLPWRRGGHPVYSLNHGKNFKYLPQAIELALNSSTPDPVSQDQGPSCH